MYDIREQGFFQGGGGGGWGVGGGICPPLALAPLGYAEISILHVNVFKHL